MQQFQKCPKLDSNYFQDSFGQLSVAHSDKGKSIYWLNWARINIFIEEVKAHFFNSKIYTMQEKVIEIYYSHYFQSVLRPRVLESPVKDMIS